MVGDLGDHVLELGRLAAHRAGHGHVADRAVADLRLEDLLAVAGLEPLRLGQQHPVALEHAAVVGEVDRRQLELLALDVVPDVELRPAREREDAHVLAGADAAVVEVPDLRAAGRAGPTGRTRRGTRTRAPSRGRAPRRGGRRRTRRRSGRSSIASSSTAVCRRLRDGPSSFTRPASIASCTEATISCSPISSIRRSRNSITSGKLWPVSTCRTGNGNAPGRNALIASWSRTSESLPPENSSTGRSSSAATSRMT